MTIKDKAIVIDLDGTLCEMRKEKQTYLQVAPKKAVVKKLREYHKRGFAVIIYTSRNMWSHDGNIGKINATTLKTILQWLDKHKIPHDEVHVGKPAPGKEGFYVDDKTIRPDEFLDLSQKEIEVLLKKSHV